MRLALTKSFEKDYKKLPRVVQKQCDRQLFTLLNNPHSSSLRTSKIQGFKNIWEGRVTKEYRFTFQIAKDVYFIRRVGKHNGVLRKP
jgi:mRNA-degrading endonuclease RelE of RelBE toxin-antitoxin system